MATGEDIDNFLSLAQIDLGTAGNLFSLFTSSLDALSVIFDPRTDFNDLAFTILENAYGFAAGAVASTAGALVTEFCLSTGGMGILALGVGALTTFVVSKLLE